MGLPCQPGVWCVSRVLGVPYAQLSSRTTTYISFTSCWRCCFGFARGPSQASSVGKRIEGIWKVIMNIIYLMPDFYMSIPLIFSIPP